MQASCGENLLNMERSCVPSHLTRAMICQRGGYVRRSKCVTRCVASHAGVFRGARISSLPREEKRAPLKTPAWEATRCVTGHDRRK